MNGGFIKMVRGSVLDDLLSDPKAFALLAQIASRARRAKAGNGVALGEAMVGDFRSIGMNKREYRRAKERLTKAELASFRGTARGTIAKLTGEQVFNINIDKRS